MTRKILIVDDMPDMLMVMRLTLSRNGWDVLEAVDGVQAIEVALHDMPDVILMDFNMPRKDGVQACAEIKQNPVTAHIPIIIYTGAFAQGLQDAAKQAGAIDFMTKPLLPAEVRQRVETAYTKKQASVS